MAVKEVRDSSGITKYYKDGILLEKGVNLTQERIEKNIDFYNLLFDYFTAYPDLFIDLITPSESNFKLFFYQRIFLRASLRFRYHYCVAPRAFSKTFISILAMILKCIFQPGSKCFICAPGKEQGAKIAKEKVEEILDKFPLLRKELRGNTYTAGADYLKMVFRNGSVFDVVAARDSQRGGRRNYGLIDEVRDHDPDTLNEVVLPLLNVNRRTVNGQMNPKEPHQAQFYMTSAGTKASFAYDKLIECLELEIINPNNAFVWGCDYRVPMKCGLLDKNYIQEIKMSSTYKDDSFAREYMGIWTGGGSDSWFDYEKISKYRRLLNPENSRKLEANKDVFYLISVDVGRFSCQTVVSVFKVFPRENEFFVNLVNIYVLGRTQQTKHFSIQAFDLKKIIQSFDPLEVVIDANGVGAGLMDFMVRPSIMNGETLPAYCAFNDENYGIKLYPDSIPLLYSLKANSTTNKLIHSNCFSFVNSGRVSLLVKETEAKNRLLSTKMGRKMKPEKRVERIMPHEMTTRLLEEMANLKLKNNINPSDIVLEMINKNRTKDKFSSFEYGLWRIKEREDEFYKKKRKKSRPIRNLTFFTQGGRT